MIKFNLFLLFTFFSSHFSLLAYDSNTVANCQDDDELEYETFYHWGENQYLRPLENQFLSNKNAEYWIHLIDMNFKQ